MKDEIGARDRALLFDMLESLRFVKQYTHRQSREAFMVDRLVQDAVCLRLAVIGEVAGKLDKPVKGLPLRAMKGLRNRIAHDYGRVDLNIVWKIVDTELPPVLAWLEGHFAADATGPAEDSEASSS